MAVDLDRDKISSRRELSIPVRGMTCASCVRRVEKALANMDVVIAREGTAQMDDLHKEITTLNETPASEKE